MDLIYRRLINLILFNNKDINFKNKNDIVNQITTIQMRTKPNPLNFQFKFKEHLKMNILFETKNLNNLPKTKINSSLHYIHK